ncbi:MAG TPA: N,N-dimethylformamidase beta subunit family domain-containing protein [Candidatus Kapabacteria bacterium]|nr:N,N-dimethylformamidase beta subunit family domain-containing protein [Candidatus Kapabacteria bacterium]
MLHTFPRRGAFFINAFVCLLFGSACAQEGAYTSSLSVSQGDTLSFFVSTTFQTYDVGIVRLGEIRTDILTIHSITGGYQPISDSAFFYGCHWKPSFSLAIPQDFKPGVYEADIPTGSGMKQIVFVVKSSTLASTSRTVVCLTTNTWQAYNNWGGKSLYNYNSKNDTGSVKVSFDRPFADTAAGLYFRWTDKLVKWLDREGIDAEFCTNQDLDRDPHFLDKYDVFVTVGHDEYWSHAERSQCQQFVDRGGRMVVLSGNTCWWQVRFENNFHTLVCYRDSSKDPFCPKQDSLVTSVWSRPPVNNKPNKLFGSNFEFGGYVNDNGLFAASQGYGGYMAYRTSSWIYDGTGIADGDVIGQSSAIVGYECDGVSFDFSNGLPVPTGDDGTPAGYFILGISPECNSHGMFIGNAAMGYMAKPHGGAVFNAATTNWTNALDSNDAVISQITYNIFKHFRDTHSLPPEIVSYAPVTITQDTIIHENVFLSHETIGIADDITDTFAVHAVDPSGHKLSYRWDINGVTAGHDSILFVTPAMKGNYSQQVPVHGVVSNGSDTASVDWYMLSSPIRFLSSPPTSPMQRGNIFSYRAHARSRFDNRPKFVIKSAPSWLKITPAGVVHIPLDTVPGMYPVTIAATDRHGNTVNQTFNIYITDTLQSRVHTAGDVLSVNSFPNPFSTRTTLTLSLRESSSVSLHIWNSLGMTVRDLFANERLEPGSQYEFNWDGTDNNGAQVPAGIYFCAFTIETSSGNAAQLVRKVVKF